MLIFVRAIAFGGSQAIAWVTPKNKLFQFRSLTVHCCSFDFAQGQTAECQLSTVNIPEPKRKCVTAYLLIVNAVNADFLIPKYHNP
ncbi:hypothetical protein [Nostoc linckia]|uniref:hypothetical protein n=1 Tax=Nostoc linckia TaxID=92942 RepID=UPI00118137D2|nr:hypothetical protein [Nostoc linckia]